uniref:calcium-activated chloride channel regulator 3A-1-like n=1 Tax=Styela clava TaxID=7725 RepID=UPI0019397988|nr:calcium-activated chloride channel regulator 3A-1-like [Styela clava]
MKCTLWLSLSLLLTWNSYVKAEISKSRVVLKDNKYTGMVIAINPRVPESNDLIDKIKESWIEASESLFVATKRRAYFREITILVPSTWTGYIESKRAEGETYDAADVIVTNPNPSYGDAPYTVQYGGCGSPGSYIHFTPNYFVNEDMVMNFGKRGKVIVHEWAHYRWGVFDETSESDPFYDDVNGNTLTDVEMNEPINFVTQCPKKYPVCCTNSDNQQNCRTGRASCRINKQTGLYDEDCLCYPGHSDGKYDSSLMSYQYLNEITQFCDANSHNRNAPNDQNRLCDLMSVWDVMENSIDFQENKNPPAGSVESLRPIFTIKMAQESQRFVLVLDVSGSMSTVDGDSGESRFDQMQKAANYFVINSVPYGSLVGIVEFDQKSRKDSDLMKVQSSADRDSLANNLPSAVGKGCNTCTCIGCGLQKGIEVLEAGNSNPAGGYLLVMTDGKETSGSTLLIEEIYDEIIEKKIVVQTLFVFTSANQILVDLSIQSGGSWFFAGGDDFLALVDAYNDMSKVTDGDDNKRTFQIFSESVRLESSNDNFGNTIPIDSTIGKNTVFTYTWSYGNVAPKVLLTPPNGVCQYTNVNSFASNPCTNIVHTIKNEYKTMRFELGNAEYGTWSSYVELPNGNSQTVTIVVTSQSAGTDVEPILVESTLSSDGSQPLVYAKVTQGLNPVIDARVTAAIAYPDGSTGTPIQLLDRGAAPDIRGNDGIYSRYITGFSSTGRYSVKVNVESSLNSKTLTQMQQSKAVYNRGYVDENGKFVSNPNGRTFLPKDTPFGVTADSMGAFARQASAGAFEHTSTGVGTDTLPPSRILDLNAAQSDFSDFSE